MRWQPSASIEALKKRAAILQKIRRFFYERHIFEVDTPHLCHTTGTDPHLESVTAHCMNKKTYLQTSPEYAMKRLLAAGSGSIYQMSKVFRDEEISRIHNPEFTMLEWYRLAWDEHQLMDEVDQLVQMILSCSAAKRYSYQAIFEQYCGLNPHEASIKELEDCAILNHLSVQGVDKKDDWLGVLMTHLIEPQLQEATFIYDFPASQAVLAKINANVAQRFELYIGGMELANGFCELTNAAEQELRFEKDLRMRKELRRPELPLDHAFLAALRAGLPECAGVALGVDRLIMLALGANNISEVISFSFDIA